jgi:hypothetical protein
MAQCDPVTVQIISEEKVTNSGSPALSMKTMPLWAGTTENPRKMRTIELVGGLGSSKVRENPNSVQGNIVLASVRRSVIVRIRAYAPLFPGFSGVFMENTRYSYDAT